MNDVFLVLAQAPGGLTCFVRAAGAAGRHPQPVRRRPAQGQARQPVQRVLRAGVPRHARPQRLGDEGRGVRTIIEMVAATRLDCVLGLGVADAARAGRGVLARGAPLRLRRLARRQAADAERDRRPRRRVRGRHRAGDPPRGGRRRRAPTRTRPRCAGSPCRSRSSGCASAPRRWWPRRWSAWAATGTSRSRACRCCSGSRRSTRSGRARATSTRSTCCGRWPASPRCSRRGSVRSGAARGADPRLDRAVDDTLAMLGDAGTLEGSARRLAGAMAACLQGSLLVRFAPARGRRRVLRHAARTRRTTAPSARSRPPSAAPR